MLLLQRGSLKFVWVKHTVPVFVCFLRMAVRGVWRRVAVKSTFLPVCCRRRRDFTCCTQFYITVRIKTTLSKSAEGAGAFDQPGISLRDTLYIILCQNISDFGFLSVKTCVFLSHKMINEASLGFWNWLLDKRSIFEDATFVVFAFFLCGSAVFAGQNSDIPTSQQVWQAQCCICAIWVLQG